MSENENVKSFREYMLSKLTPEQQKERQEGIEEVGIDLYEGDFWLRDSSNVYNELGEYTIQNEVTLSELAWRRALMVSSQVEEDKMEFSFIDELNHKRLLRVWVNEKGKLQERLE